MSKVLFSKKVTLTGPGDQDMDTPFGGGGWGGTIQPTADPILTSSSLDLWASAPWRGQTWPEATRGPRQVVWGFCTCWGQQGARVGTQHS